MKHQKWRPYAAAAAALFIFLMSIGPFAMAAYAWDIPKWDVPKWEVPEWDIPAQDGPGQGDRNGNEERWGDVGDGPSNPADANPADPSIPQSEPGNGTSGGANGNKLEDPFFYGGKAAGVSATSAMGLMAFKNGHRLLQVIDGPTGTVTGYLVTGTKPRVAPNGSFLGKVGTPLLNFAEKIGRRGKQVKDASVKGLFGILPGKKEQRVLPANNHYVKPGKAFTHTLGKAGGWAINGALSTYQAYKEYGFGNSDFASKAITETAFGVGAAAAGSAIGTALAGALVGASAGSTVPIVGTIIGAVAGGVIAIGLETEVGRKIKEGTRKVVKKAIDGTVEAGKKAWKAVKGWFGK